MSLITDAITLRLLQEEPEFAEDRIIITEEEEEARRAAKKSWFGRSKKAKPGSGLSSPQPASSRPPSIDKARKPGEAPPKYDEDADDLPPRASLEKSGAAATGHSKLRSSIDETEERWPSASPPLPTDNSGTESPSAALPVTAGFDFAAISRALGKDIDVDALKAPAAGPQAAALPAAIEVKPPLERSESTPPSAAAFDDPASALWAKSDLPCSSPLATSSMHDLSRLSFDPTPVPADDEDDSWSSAAHAVPSPSSPSYDTNAWGATSPYRSASASSSAALPSFSSLHKPTRGFSHHLPPPDEPAMTFGGSDGSFSRSKEDEVDDPWKKPLPRPGAGGFVAGKGVLDNPWG